MQKESIAGQSAKSILFVDDDFDDFEIFKDAFYQINPEGRIIHQWDCSAALNFLRESPRLTPDYIFLDINMPVMTGDECLKELKADADLKNIPVIMFSTTIGPAQKEKYEKLGAAKAFVKPTSFTDVVRIIQSLE